MKPGLKRQVATLERTLRTEDGRCATCGGLHAGDYLSAALCGEPVAEPCRCCAAMWRRLAKEATA